MSQLPHFRQRMEDVVQVVDGGKHASKPHTTKIPISGWVRQRVTWMYFWGNWENRLLRLWSDGTFESWQANTDEHRMS